jgi:CspA family cold shock protein
MYLLKRSFGLDNNNTVRENGMIHAYDSFKGFGFIRRDKGKDVFFLYDGYIESNVEPSVGDLVSFEINMQPKGPKAQNIIKEGSINP